MNKTYSEIATNINGSIIEAPDMITPILIIIGCYFLGSIPFGLIITRIFRYGDIRKIGSGNIGATNVLRTGNKKLAALTLLLDISKGAFVPIIILLQNNCIELDIYDCELYEVVSMLVYGFIVVLGHCFPIWLKFKGGKGVATALGVLLVAVPYAGFAACGAWIISFLIFRISSLSALIALIIAPISIYLIYGFVFTLPAIICTAITALVWHRHKDNIKRLMAGTEPRIGKKKGNESQGR